VELASPSAARGRRSDLVSRSSLAIPPVCVCQIHQLSLLGSSSLVLIPRLLRSRHFIDSHTIPTEIRTQDCKQKETIWSVAPGPYPGRCVDHGCIHHPACDGSNRSSSRTRRTRRGRGCRTYRRRTSPPQHAPEVRRLQRWVPHAPFSFPRGPRRLVCRFA
jgi:hypothetical protein